MADALEKDPKCKLVVFSQWTAELDLIDYALQSLPARVQGAESKSRGVGIGYVRLDGDVKSAAAREDILKRFRSDSKVSVLLASLCGKSSAISVRICNVT